jgi:MSHA pilin protein MshC
MQKYCLNRGFSLIELIVTIILLAIISTYAIPRLDLNPIKNQGFYDLATSSIRYAQKRAVSTGCIVEFQITNAGCHLNWDSCDSGSNLTNPSNNNTNFCLDSEPDGNVSNGTFQFDRIGRPMDTMGAELTSSEDITIGTRTIRLEAQTGYVHEP